MTGQEVLASLEEVRVGELRCCGGLRTYISSGVSGGFNCGD